MILFLGQRDRGKGLLSLEPPSKLKSIQTFDAINTIIKYIMTVLPSFSRSKNDASYGMT